MIRKMTDAAQIRDYMNSVPYPEHVPEECPLNSKKAFVLGVYSPDLKGCFPINVYSDRVKIHACFPQENRGQFAVYAAKAAFKWIFDNTPHNIIQASIAERHVRHYARLCGMSKRNGHYEVTRWADL